MAIRSAWRGVKAPPARLPGCCLAALLALAPAAPRADNGIGGWSALADWPLIAIHAMLLPNGTVMTYGTNGDGQQTGRFVYDVWDPRAGLEGGHLTLPNTTTTDLFCGAQIILPGSEDVFLAGGDVWNGKATTGASNDDTLTFDPDTNTLVPGADMGRARWYASLTTLPNGEIYIQGGRQRASQGGNRGVDLAEVRTTGGALRALTGMSTAELNWWYPRNWVAPDGRIFGFAYRKMYYVDPTGAGTLTRVGAMPASGPEGVTSSEAMFAPGRILRTGGGAYAAVGSQPGRTAAVVIDINGARPQDHRHRTPAGPAAVAQRHRGARRPGRRHRRQCHGRPDGGRQRPRLSLVAGHRQMDRGGADRLRPCAPLPLDRAAAPRRLDPGGGRRAPAATCPRTTPTPRSTTRPTSTTAPAGSHRGRGSPAAPRRCAMPARTTSRSTMPPRSRG